MPAERRHALVIASQCDQMEELKHLETAARELAAALLGSGKCEPGLPGRDDAYVYGKLSVADIHRFVVEAVEYAAQEEAELVLSFLGHGFTPGASSSHLYFMGKESDLDKTLHAYDVPQGIQNILDYPGLSGLVVIVDTCAAAGAVPVAEALGAGAKSGDKRLTLLVGCSVLGEGIDMAVARNLAAILRKGIPGQGEYLTFADIKPVLQEHVPGQDPAHLDWNSARNSAPLWVAHNAAWPAQPLRAADHPELCAALAVLFGDAADVPSRWDRTTIAEYRQRVGALPNSLDRDHAEQLLADLDVADKTKRILRTWLRRDLTKPVILRALELVGRAPPKGPVNLAAVLADIADGGYPHDEPGCQYTMARVVAALGRAAGKDLDDPDVRAWAEDVDAAEEFNDAVARFRSLDDEATQPRLVVSLASFTDGWPDELAAYVLYGSAQPKHQVFPCGKRDEGSVVKALVTAVRWGHRQAYAAGGRLTRVDVAARESVLLRWRPELVEVGTRLGVGFDVRLRWSEQIAPPDDIWWVNDMARACLEHMAQHFGPPPLAWITREHAESGETLRGHFVDGRYRHKALSLDHLPTDPALFRLLKAYSAIVLWPGDGELSPRARQQMHECWHRLPESIRAAFRAELCDNHGEVPGSLRTVWDDLAWLDFCDMVTPLNPDDGSEQ